MAQEKKINQNLMEELASLGIDKRIGSMEEQEALSGLVNPEGNVITGGLFARDRINLVEDDKDEDEKDKLEESTDDSFGDEDQLNVEHVTVELVDRIKKLPFDIMSKDDFNELKEEFGKKTIPDDLKEAAQEVIDLFGEKEKRFEDDALDSDTVNEIMIEKIKNIDFSQMTNEDLDELQKALEEKNVPDEFEEVVQGLFDKIDEEQKKGKKAYKVIAGKKQVVFMKRGAELRKARKQHKKTTRKHHAKIEMMRKKRAKRPTMAMKKTARYHRAHGEGSELARDIQSMLSESGTVKDESPSLREEIIDRIGEIFEILERNIDDEQVTDLMEEHYSGLLTKYDDNQLSEDTVDEDTFLKELKPCLIIMKKCYDQVESQDSDEDEELTLDDGDLLGNLRQLASNV